VVYNSSYHCSATLGLLIRLNTNRGIAFIHNKNKNKSIFQWWGHCLVWHFFCENRYPPSLDLFIFISKLVNAPALVALFNGTCSSQLQYWCRHLLPCQLHWWLWYHYLVWRRFQERRFCSDSDTVQYSEAELWGWISEEMAGELQYLRHGCLWVGISLHFSCSPCFACRSRAIYPKNCRRRHCSYTHTTTYNYSLLKVRLLSLFIHMGMWMFC